MGSIANKYRVHEVAKDFGVSTKEITEILTKYAETPKNHMQVLEDRELSLIFEYLTQHNPVSSIAVIFAEGAKPEEKKAEKPAARRASYYDEVELALTDFLGRKVKVGTKPGKESGVLEIDFFDKEDLSRLADALKSLGD